jgi:hypothetical protein
MVGQPKMNSNGVFWPASIGIEAYVSYETRGGIHQSFFDERLKMISSLDFLQFTIHKRDSAKSTTQKHDPEISTGSCFCFNFFLF